MRRTKFAFLVAGLTALFLSGAAAKASATTYNLTSDHCSGGCGPAGTIFGTVTLTQNGTTVDVTVHLNSPYGFAKTGAADDQAFKFNATGVVVGDITIDAHVPALTASTGAYNGDGTGTFGFGIACTSCGGGMSGTFNNDIVFHVANATIADLTAANSSGNVFVADIGTVGGNTGPVAATTVCPDPCTRDLNTPEPTTLLLMGTGLLIATKGLRRFVR